MSLNIGVKGDRKWMNDEYYGQFWAAIAAERIRNYG